MEYTFHRRRFLPLMAAVMATPRGSRADGSGRASRTHDGAVRACRSHRPGRSGRPNTSGTNWATRISEINTVSESVSATD